jgi:hypothetical protein
MHKTKIAAITTTFVLLTACGRTPLPLDGNEDSSGGETSQGVLLGEGYWGPELDCPVLKLVPGGIKEGSLYFKVCWLTTPPEEGYFTPQNYPLPEGLYSIHLLAYNGANTPSVGWIGIGNDENNCSEEVFIPSDEVPPPGTWIQARTSPYLNFSDQCSHETSCTSAAMDNMFNSQAVRFSGSELEPSNCFIGPEEKRMALRQELTLLPNGEFGVSICSCEEALPFETVTIELWAYDPSAPLPASGPDPRKKLIKSWSPVLTKGECTVQSVLPLSEIPAEVWLESRIYPANETSVDECVDEFTRPCTDNTYRTAATYYTVKE